MKPTWGAITREGQKMYSLTLDTLGLFARSVEDLDLLANVFALADDATPEPDFQVKGAKFALLKTMVWPEAGPGTVNAIETAAKLLRDHGAEVEEIELPPEFDQMPHWHHIIFETEGRTTFLPEYVTAKDKLQPFIRDHVENKYKISRASQLEALDGVSALRPEIDKIASQYAAILTPSAIDEAPVGLEHTGSPCFNIIWTVEPLPAHNRRMYQLKFYSIGFTYTGNQCPRLQGCEQYAYRGIFGGSEVSRSAFTVCF
jgi:Asp-tRNA(Asn)/Glu-tRNA(Gln) amidotransferase A subunit family amidase